MSKVKELDKEIQFLADLKYLTETYEEIAVMQMKKIRQLILESRRFMDHLRDIFVDVRSSYRRKVEELLKQKKKMFNNKRLAIVITSDNRLYGGLVVKVVKLFEGKINKYDKAVIIGKIGGELIRAKGLHKQVKVVFWEGGDLQNANLERLVGEFDKVDVFYPRFENLVTQVVEVMDISGYQAIGGEVGEVRGKVGFLVEPNIQEVFVFFKTRAMMSLFNGSLGESRLALLAARIRSMEKALGEVEEQLEHYMQARRQEKRLEEDKRQLEQLSGISIWQKPVLF